MVKFYCYERVNRNRFLDEDSIVNPSIEVCKNEKEREERMAYDSIHSIVCPFEYEIEDEFLSYVGRNRLREQILNTISHHKRARLQQKLEIIEKYLKRYGE